MTDKERQKLCHDLREYIPTKERLHKAAAEIERLAALAQSDAEPVAWRIKDFADGWMFTGSVSTASTHKAAEHVEPLYTAPPRPNASAGLIEAAEIAEEWDSGWGEDRNTRVARQTAIEIAEAIRARAADRSAK